MGALREEWLGRLPGRVLVELPPEKDEYQLPGKQRDWPYVMCARVHRCGSNIRAHYRFESNTDPVVQLLLSPFYS